ncbi:K+/H+ antiporter subunit F [Aliidiomarina haloalkalitolerans]|uniref:K+/H+ antiporter subunit F n=1 Tax=Aliidiomarina haloalkalitolerans TaxID=859059 RepID=A0A432VVT3_9GAMM|nr:K+/H+ antiporter subunit F [Aliidiomarina haloalkalitolerans]RUO20668.1 K+/H+ antiporter subunit F [Aliidiomarina haloalkalitolerans]
MLAHAVTIALALFSIAILFTLYRLIVGPDVVDRILALDTMAVNLIAVIVLTGIRMGSNILFEAALLIALMGFVSTVALTRYLMRGDLIE